MKPTILIVAVTLHALACSSSQPGASDPTERDGAPAEGDAAASPAGEQPSGERPGASNTAPAPAPAQAGPPGDMGVVLVEHNRYRAQHCAPALQWSDQLASGAQKWADRLAKGCQLEHSQGAHGENLAAGTEGSMGPERAVEIWYEERKLHDFASAGFSMKAGHFTQVVWRGSQRVGCGSSSCNGLRIWVCNYDPPGNMAKQFKHNVLPATCKKK